MSRRGEWPDPIALAVLAAALVAWVLGAGWWTPLVGSILLGFGPGYLLLRGSAQSVPDIVVRLGLYIGSSLAVSALVGLAIATAGLPLMYASFASTYLVIVVLLFVGQEVVATRSSNVTRTERGRWRLDGFTLVRGSLLVALPFLGSWVLFATAPVRSPVVTELYFAPAGGQIRTLPTTYQRTTNIEFRVIGLLGVPATAGVLQVFVADQLVDSWNLGAGSIDVDKLVSVDASRVASGTLRIEARLLSPGQRDFSIWLSLTEAVHEDTPP